MLNIQQNNFIKSTLSQLCVSIGIVSVLFISTAYKQDPEPKNQAQTNELSFLDYDLNQANFEAQNDFDTKKYRRAIKKYIELLHHKPNDIQTLYNLAGCYAQIKKPEYSVKVLYHLINAGLNDLTLFSSDSIWNPIQNSFEFLRFMGYIKALQSERGEMFYAESKTIIKGFLRRPDNYDSTKAYPLLIIMHGYGANPESYMSIRDKMEASNMFFAAPQGQYIRKSIETNSPSYSWYLWSQNKKLWKRADPLAENYIIEVVKEIESHYKISHVYLLGHSQGAVVAYQTGIGNPELFGGIICFGGPNPTKYLSNDELMNASNKLPIFISHGWADPQVNFDDAQEAKQLFQKYKFNITFKPFQGGHGLETNALLEAKKWIDTIEAKN